MSMFAAVNPRSSQIFLLVRGLLRKRGRARCAMAFCPRRDLPSAGYNQTRRQDFSAWKIKKSEPIGCRCPWLLAGPTQTKNCKTFQKSLSLYAKKFRTAGVFPLYRSFFSSSTAAPPLPGSGQNIGPKPCETEHGLFNRGAVLLPLLQDAPAAAGCQNLDALGQ